MLTSYQNLLVAVDGSLASLHAVEEACRLAPSGLVVAAVAPPLQPAGRGGKLMPPLSLESASRALEKAQGIAAHHRRPMEAVALGGDPHARLVDLARERGCDLIVMGRKGSARPGKALMGSTVARVIGYAPLDVLVVPLEAKVELKRILCPLDGSRFSKEALNRALALAGDRQGELLAVSVLDAPPGFAHEVPDVAQEILAGLEKLVRDAARQAAAQGLTCHTRVYQGSAYRAIVEAADARQADLIVMGSHGRTGLRRLLMGSVTERVIGYSPCAILVVKARR
jgi:nucleotide-binding universal stress UspA family protein